MTVPVTTQLGRAMVAVRTGWFRPVRVGRRVTGELYLELVDAQIAARLPPDRLARFLDARDAVRDAVTQLHAAGPDESAAAFDACAARLPEFADDPDLDDLVRAWLEQAWAFLHIRRKDIAAAEACLRRAMRSDIRLERRGYGLMHVRRIHKVHLWLRVLAARGELEAALTGADAVVAYCNGFGGELPLGGEWSGDAAAAVPAELAAGMTCRVAGDVGVALCGLDQRDSAAALDLLPALDRLDPEIHREIVDWTRLKRAWAEGRADDFLALAVPYLSAGRRDTCLSYAALLDLCRAAVALRPRQTRPFCARVAAFARSFPAMPRSLRLQLEKLEDEPAAPWTPTVPARRFQLVCAGLPRSGAESLCTLFGNFRAANEYAEGETIRMLVGHRKGRVSAGALRAYLARRDREGALEMDAASFLYLAGGELAALGGDARFVLPVRDPEAWFESYIGMLLRWLRGLRARGETPPAWRLEYAEVFLGGFDLRDIASPGSRRKHLRRIAPGFLEHWARAMGKRLDTLPPERTLVLRTRDIGPMRDRLAAFAGLPGDALGRLGPGAAAPPSPGPLEGLPEGWLARAAAEICGPVHARTLRRCAR